MSPAIRPDGLSTDTIRKFDQPLVPTAVLSVNTTSRTASWSRFSRAPSRSSPCVAATVTSGCAPASGSASTLLDRRRDWRVVGALAGGVYGAVPAALIGALAGHGLGDLSARRYERVHVHAVRFQEANYP